MTMAGEVLTRSQRKLWKRLDAGERLDNIADHELSDWIAACRTLIASADRGPAPAAKSRRLWQSRLRGAESELGRRSAQA
jgi:hypothetical protein